jgi:hypothetical protein
MSQPTYDLSKLFGAALETMTAQRQEINALDGYNGNHGDNMVENLRLITESLQEKSSQTPTEALKHASQQLQSHGRGGTSQYYATGLSQAAKQLQGRPSLDGNDVMSLVQSVLGAIPSEGHQPQPQAGSSVLDQVLGMSSGDDVLNTLLPAGLAFLQAKQSGADTATAATQALASTLMGGQTNPLQASTPRAAAGGLVAQSILQALATRR